MRSLRTPLLVASLLALPIGAAHAQTPPPEKAAAPPSTPPAATSAAPLATPPAAPPAATTSADPATTSSATTEGAPAKTAAASEGLPPLAKDDAVAGGIGIASLVVGLALVGVASGMQGGLASSAPKDSVGNPVCGKKPGADAIDPADVGKCDSLRSQAALGSTLGNVGVGVAVTGGLLVGAAAAYWLFSTPAVAPGPRSTSGNGSRSASATPTLRIAPAVSPGFGGVVVVGSF